MSEAAQLLARLRGAPAMPGDASGADALSAVEAYLARFVAYPSEHARVAHVLWIAHTHAMAAWESTPRLAFLSPEPGSGKTRALEVTAPLVPNPVEAVNVTAAYLFRKVGSGDCTVLFDEVDTVFGPKVREANEDIRALLNAGHRRGAIVGRCVPRGREIAVEEWPAYAPVALAGLGDLPDTILTRSVVVRMRRRAPDERVEPFRVREHEPEGHALRQRLAAWVASVRDALAAARPAMPAGVEDRDADCWEALLAIADAAGGDWPERARVAAVALVAEARGSTPSLGIRLLADLRAVFGDRDAMATADIIEALCALDEAPWADINGGKPINARGLANRLKPYGISSRTVRIGNDTPKGYRREDLSDAWRRYLPPVQEDGDRSPPPDGTSLLREESATSATGATSQQSGGFSSATRAQQNATSATTSPNGAEKMAVTMRDFWRDRDGVADVADVADVVKNGAAAAGRVCVECGEPLPVDWPGLYCARHGGTPARMRL